MELIDSIEKLEAVYGEKNPKAVAKEADHIIPEYAAFIERSPFCMIATVGPEGLDVSPRGDPQGRFVRIVDPKMLMLPDRRGNNRVDSLRNIVRDPRISMIFMIPGIGETMRVTGTADLTVDPDLLESFAMDGKLPRSVIRIHVETVYFQCQKALARSRLWFADSHAARDEVPTAGQMLQAMIKSEPFDGEAYDRGYPDHMKETIY
ncbi:pyridoxamine 5'-phosphate oxidase family protein [Minwuia sp.]|uniref:pyridoxamine 5'-phosphate oxidase family protein n=1 Tax=Minwuia sp. TaxID=2493630 RepID=UPI003A8CB41B